MATPIGTHIGESFESMWDPVVQLLLFRIRLGIGFADTFGDDFRIAFLVARVFAVGALHPGRILEEIATEGTSHDVVELLRHELVPIHLMNFLPALADSTFAVQSDIESGPIL